MLRPGSLGHPETAIPQPLGGLHRIRGCRFPTLAPHGQNRIGTSCLGMVAPDRQARIGRYIFRIRLANGPGCPAGRASGDALASGNSQC